MRALITGSHGFTGRHLKKTLIDNHVTVIDFTGDLKESNNTDNVVAAARPDWIFHLASPLIRTDKLIDSALVENLKTDLFGTINLIQAAAKLVNKPKILITGTAAVYQDNHYSLTEKSRLQPDTSYGLSKLTQELVSVQLCQSYQIPLIMTRTFLLIGPGQKSGFVVTDLARAVAARANFVTLGNPKISRDFTDVRDACRAYYFLMRQGKPGEVYNVCSGKAVSVANIAKQLIRLSGHKIKVKAKSTWRQNDPLIVCGNNAKLTRLGWHPQIPLAQTLKDTLNYWHKH